VKARLRLPLIDGQTRWMSRRSPVNCCIKLPFPECVAGTGTERGAFMSAGSGGPDKNGLTSCSRAVASWQPLCEDMHRAQSGLIIQSRKAKRVRFPSLATEYFQCRASVPHLVHVAPHAPKRGCSYVFLEREVGMVPTPVSKTGRPARVRVRVLHAPRRFGKRVRAGAGGRLLTA
jgi:hypothetical protein